MARTLIHKAKLIVKCVRCLDPASLPVNSMGTLLRFFFQNRDRDRDRDRDKVRDWRTKQETLTSKDRATDVSDTNAVHAAFGLKLGQFAKIPGR